MTSPATIPHVETGLLLLADISGYSAFLNTVATAHPEMVRPGGPVPPAYAVMSSLLDVVLDRIAPTFSLAEIEGDAVFAYAFDDARGLEGGEHLLRIVQSAYDGFRGRIDAAMVVHKHDCQACFLLPSLELKFILHHGDFVVQAIAGRARLLGPTVNVAHRLLKNRVTEETGHRAYLLITDAAAARLQFVPDVGLSHAGDYPDVGPIRGQVIGLANEGQRPGPA